MADSVTFRFSGGEQFAVDLRDWRDRLRAEVHESARQQASMIAAEVRSQLPVKTGNLQQHITVTDQSAGDAVRFVIRSTAAHSHLYESGTKPRWTTGSHRVSAETEFTSGVRAHLGLPMRFKLAGGKRAFRGSMPARPIFIPEAIERRAYFKRDVRQIMGSPEPSLGSGSPTVTGSL